MKVHEVQIKNNTCPKSQLLPEVTQYLIFMPYSWSKKFLYSCILLNTLFCHGLENLTFLKGSDLFSLAVCVVWWCLVGFFFVNKQTSFGVVGFFVFVSGICQNIGKGEVLLL